MAKLSGAEFTVGLVLIAIGFFAAGAGLLQFPPTTDSVKVYTKDTTTNWSYSIFTSLSTNWEPDRATNFTGISVKLRWGGEGGGSAEYTVSFLAICNSKVIGAGQARLQVSEGASWYTIPTFEAQNGRVSAGFTKGAACSVELKNEGGTDANFKLVWRRDGQYGRFTLVAWGYGAAALPPSTPGPPATSGGTSNAGSGTTTPPPPPPPPPDVGAMFITAIVLLVLILGGVLLVLGLAGVFG